MAVSKELERYLVGQLEAAGSVRSRRMFGGVGLYVDDAFCAIVAAGSGRLYLKVDDSNRADYERAGMEPFTTPKGTMSYWTVPEEVVEDRETLATWVRKARRVALSSKPSRKKRSG